MADDIWINTDGSPSRVEKATGISFASLAPHWRGGESALPCIVAVTDECPLGASSGAEAANVALEGDEPQGFAAGAHGSEWSNVNGTGELFGLISMDVSLALGMTLTRSCKRRLSRRDWADRSSLSCGIQRPQVATKGISAGKPSADSPFLRAAASTVLQAPSCITVCGQINVMFLFSKRRTSRMESTAVVVGRKRTQGDTTLKRCALNPCKQKIEMMSGGESRSTEERPVEAYLVALWEDDDGISPPNVRRRWTVWRVGEMKSLGVAEEAINRREDADQCGFDRLPRVVERPCRLPVRDSSEGW